MAKPEDLQLLKIRHSLAHVLAQAVQHKFPGVKLGFGPATETGFYYDFDFGEVHVAESDLKELQERMRKIILEKQAFMRIEGSAEEALEKLREAGDETYKVENVKNLSARGEDLFTFYRNGPFIDLCEGPHVEHTGQLPADAFKLDRIAGAYWLGDERNKMLTRIYGLAFKTRRELKDYLERRRVAEQFDHKKLGKELELYHQEDIVGKGLILWLPNGTIIRDEIEKYVVEREFDYGYQRVATPHIAKADLFRRSLHLPSYQDSMFPPLTVEDDGRRTEFYLKPMNCPHHHLIYAARPRSYRELPLRLAEYGTVYRYEQSGETSGLIRVRCMSMNDAHIYLRPDQFKTEFQSLIKLYMEFYDTFRLKEYEFRLSIRGEEEKEKFRGSEKMWSRAEELLAEVMDEMGVPYYTAEGEAAFYGPKVDIQFRNLMGREETVSTIQVDYLSPENFELTYIDEDGQEKRPIIFHRAPLSTHERFISFLIEYYGGAFPTWCAPHQVAIVPVNLSCYDYADELSRELSGHRIRVLVDRSGHSFNKKIRVNTVNKIPIILVVGNKEVEAGTVTVRRYGVKKQQVMSREEFTQMLLEEISNRRMLREPMGSII
jgi:threonyl-tRNA synthetase